MKRWDWRIVIFGILFNIGLSIVNHTWATMIAWIAALAGWHLVGVRGRLIDVLKASREQDRENYLKALGVAKKVLDIRLRHPEES